MWLFKKNRKISINYLVEKKNIYTFANAKINGPFVYRLGLKIFILARGVRFPYGLQIKNVFYTTLFLVE